MKKKPKKPPVLVEKWIQKTKKALSKKNPHEAILNIEKAIPKCHSLKLFHSLNEILDLHLKARSQIERIVIQKRCPVKIIKDQDALNIEKKKLTTGRYLLQPPLVGADARDFRIFAESKKIPLLVMCREPKTKKKKYPIVSIGASSAIRAQIDQPKNPEKPTVAWFNTGNQALEKMFLEQFDEREDPEKALNAMLGGLQTLPHSSCIHQSAKEILNTLIENQEQE